MMIKLKDTLGEDFGGSYGGNKNRRWDSAPGYSRGEWDDTYKHKPQNDVEANFPAEWDALVDSVNQRPNIEASEEIDYRAAISKLKNVETGEVWMVILPQGGDMYVAYRPDGRFSDNSVKTLDDLIASFKESVGEVSEAKQPRWWDSDGDGEGYEPGEDVKESALAENMRRFGTKNIQG